MRYFCETEYRTLIRMVSMIAVPSAVDSAPTFLLGNNAEGYPIFQHWEYYVMVILLILLVVQAVHLIVKLLSYMARNSVLFSPFSAIVRSVMDERVSALCFRFESEFDSVTLRVKPLYVPPQQVKLISELNMRSFRIETDCLRVRLCLDWGSTVIHQ